VDFTDDFVEELELKKKEFEKALSTEKLTDKSQLTEKVKSCWHSLPEKYSTECSTKYAVDGSRAVRKFSNGFEFLVSRALMIGGNSTKNRSWKGTFVDLYRGPGKPEVTNRYERLISQITETEVILDNLEEIPKGSTIYIDGSLHGKYIRPLWSLELEGRESAPFELVRKHIDLINKANERNITLIGISKASQIRVLSKELLNKDWPDAEILFKFTKSPGYSTPIAIGGYGFASDEYLWLQENPKRFAQAVTTEAINEEQTRRLISDLRKSPAIFTFHMRLEPNNETMRIDVPLNALDIDHTLTSFKARPMDPSLALPICKHIREDYGDMKVYNSLLYTVDQMVRLKKQVVDQVYLKVANDVLDSETPLEVTRSYRRFM